MGRPETAGVLALPDVSIGHTHWPVSNPTELPHLWAQESKLLLGDLRYCLQLLLTGKVCARAAFHPLHSTQTSNLSQHLSESENDSSAPEAITLPSLFYGLGGPSLQWGGKEPALLCLTFDVAPSVQVSHVSRLL